MNILIFIGAYLLDLILGDPKNWPHPVKAMGWVIEKGEGPLRKKFKEEWGGAMLTFGLVIITFLVTFFLCSLCFKIHRFFGVALSIFLGYTTISVRSLIEEATDVKRELLQRNLPRARIKLSRIVGRDTNNLSEQDVIRATVETVAENTTDGIISPFFYLALGGVPLAMAYKAINTLDSMIGYRDERYIKFGKFSAILDEIANFIPVRITALGFVISSCFSGLKIKQGFGFILRRVFNLNTTSSIISEGVAASVLGVRLGGVNYYKGKPIEMPYLGKENRTLEIKDINHTNKLAFLTGLIFVVIVVFIKLI